MIKETKNYNIIKKIKIINKINEATLMFFIINYFRFTYSFFVKNYKKKKNYEEIKISGSIKKKFTNQI